MHDIQHTLPPRHGQESIARAIRQRLEEARSDGFTPLSERAVAREFAVSRLTARRALRLLVRSGHLLAAPRRGYWPGSPLNGAAAPPRIACIQANAEAARTFPPGCRVASVMTTVQQLVAKAGGSCVAVAPADFSSGRLDEHLRSQQVNGVVLDCDSADAFVIAASLSMPCVVVNTSTDAVTADVLVQNNTRGGYLAARHLQKLGHRRIAWLGAPPANGHARERLGGFLSAFVERGWRFDPRWSAFAALGDRDGALESATRLLKLHPTAIVALWTDLAAWAWLAIRAAGLRIPEDISLVAWGSEENMQTVWDHYCGGQAPLPDAVQWQLSDMAEAVLSRLTERQRNPLTRPAKLHMAVDLTVRGSSAAPRREGKEA